MIIRAVPVLVVLALLGGLGPLPAEPARAEGCESAVRKLNQDLLPQVNEKELVDILETLNQTGNHRLPPKFVTKGQARRMGWKPGRDLWDSWKLRGKSIGGDFFANREGKLPDGKRTWREADLDYRGGRRGPKRIVFSDDGLRFVTVDHYGSYKEVPPCR